MSMITVVLFKQKTAYEVRSSDWSSDVCSSDLAMAASGLPKDEVGALIFALCRPYTLQKYFATFLANYLRLPLSGTIMEVLGNGMTGGLAFDEAVNKIGRASCRDSVCQSG